MTVKDLRTLIDNLDEYIHVPDGIERLKKTILHLAVSGQLVPQDSSEGTGGELYEQIQAEKQNLIVEGKLKNQKPLTKITDEEIPFEIPSSWKWVRVSDIMQIRGGKRVPKGRRLQSNPGSVYIRVTDMINHTVNVDRLQYVDDQTSEVIKKYVINASDIYLTIAGTIGRVGKIPRQLDGAHLTENACRLTPLVDTLHQDFYITCLSSNLVQKQFTEKVVQMAQPKLALFRIANTIIPLPGAEEQKRINEQIQRYFSLIDVLVERHKMEQEERSKLVKASLSKLAKEQDRLALGILTDVIKTKEDVAELRKTILHLAVSGQLAPQDPSEGTGEELYEQIQDEKQKLILEGRLKKQKKLPKIVEDEFPFDIPKSWKWVRLGDVANITMGQSPAGKSINESKIGIPFYQGKTEFGVDTPSPRKWCEVPKKIAQPGSVLISVRAPIGGTNYSTEKCGIGRGLASVQPLDKMPKEFFRIILDISKSYLESKGTGTTFTAIRTSDLLELLTPLPSLSEQKRIIQKVIQLFKLMDELEKQLEE